MGTQDTRIMDHDWHRRNAQHLRAEAIGGLAAQAYRWMADRLAGLRDWIDRTALPARTDAEGREERALYRR